MEAERRSPPAQEPAGPIDGVGSSASSLPAEELWERHGTQAYLLACVLLGDEAAAMRAVGWGMADFALSGLSMSTDDSRRALARHVYWRSRELVGETPGDQVLPRPMEWVARLAQLQRSCLALCMFGSHTHKQASALLEIPPLEGAALLRSALQELGRPITVTSAMAVAG